MSHITIVPLAPDHASALTELQKICFPTVSAEERLDERHFLTHCRVCPEGNFVALDGARVVGLGSGFFTDFDFDHVQHTFIEMVAHNYYTNHDPNGAYYYGADISVHPDYRGRGIGRKLYEARKAVVQQYNKKGIVAGAMIPGFADYKATLSAAEYVAKVVAGELFDSTLSFQLRNGFIVKRLLENYLDDPAHDNWAVLILWNNPAYQP